MKHREDLDPQRFAVVQGAYVCTAPPPGYVGRTACYAEHSTRRKNCPLLSTKGDSENFKHDPGLYVNGLSPYDGDDAFSGKEGQMLILGPYVKDAQNVTIKRISFKTVFERHSDPDDVAPRFSMWKDSVIPSISMLTDTAKSLREVQTSPVQMGENLKECSNQLLRRQAQLQHLKRMCNQRTDIMRVCRRMLKNVFFFAMYGRNWKGPGTPYPITNSQTNRKVTTDNLSDDLVDMAVHVTDIGEVVLRERKDGDNKADRVQAGKAMAMMDAYMLATCYAVDSLPNFKDRKFIIENVLIANRQLTADNTHWPAKEALWDTLFGGETPAKEATECILQISSTLLATCNMLTPVFYKTQPQWMRYEGVLDEIK